MVWQRCRKHFESGGCISTFFLFFCQFQKVGDVTKSRPIDPFFNVIYLFLNVRFGQKSVQISYFLPSAFAQPPIFSSFLPLKNFFTPLKIFLHPNNFFTSYIFLKPPNFCCAPSPAPIFKSLQKVGEGVLTPKILPASASLWYGLWHGLGYSLGYGLGYGLRVWARVTFALVSFAVESAVVYVICMHIARIL